MVGYETETCHLPYGDFSQRIAGSGYRKKRLRAIGNNFANRMIREIESVGATDEYMNAETPIYPVGVANR